MKNANKRAVLITGAAKRIGKKLAIMLASRGYDIAISYNSSQKDADDLAQKITGEFKVKCKIFQADLKNIKEAEALALKAVEAFPHLNLLINNASIFNKSKFLDENFTEFSDNLNLHLMAPMLLSWVFAKHVSAKKITDAQIINMVDKNIVRFDTKYFYYLLTKKFLAEMTKMLSLQLAPEIRVNAVAPGFILNSINEENPNKETQNLLAKIPLKSQGSIDDILHAFIYLLENKFVTGQIIFVDGGASLNHAG